MDDQVNAIKDLERAKAVALAALASAVFIFLITGGINLLQGFRARAMVQQAEVMTKEAEAQRERAEALMQHALQRQQAEAAKQKERDR